MRASPSTGAVDESRGSTELTVERATKAAYLLREALALLGGESEMGSLAFVGYGGVGAARAVEQLRLVAAELQMVSLRHAVHVGMVEFLGIWQQGKSFDDFPHLAQAANALLDDLAWWAKALQGARAAMAG